MATDALGLALAAATALLAPYFLYLGLVAVAALLRRPRRGEAAAGPGTTRFLFVIPAHDEEGGIAATVASCRACAYDPGRVRVLVIADNCTDGTAEAARRAGAEVVERRDSERRSKGYALEDVLTPATLGDADAAVVVDADTEVGPGMLRAFDAAMAAGADWMQGYYTVRNPDASWRTRLMTYAFSLFNGVALLGAEGLGLGAGLKGNGMCFTARGLRRVPWRASGLVEDLEFTWRLHALGERVRFVPEALALGEMVSRGAAAASQRRRWEAGRRGIPARCLGPVLRSPALPAWRKVLYALQMTCPPLVTLALGLALVACVHPAARALPGLAPAARRLLPWHLGMAAALLAYALSPVAAMGLPPRYLKGLALVPYYAAWKLAVSAGRAPATWVRTRREAASGAGGRGG